MTMGRWLDATLVVIILFALIDGWLQRVDAEQGNPVRIGPKIYHCQELKAE